MDVVNTLKKDIKDMNVMELIEEITETTKIAALNLWGNEQRAYEHRHRRMRSKNEKYPAKSKQNETKRSLR